MTPLVADPAPEIDLASSRTDTGWRITATTRNFDFREDLADQPHEPGTGHGHLYIEGLKLQRLYGPDAVIGDLPPGRYEVRVSLNTNDHRPYMADGVPVSASVILEVD